MSSTGKERIPQGQSLMPMATVYVMLMLTPFTLGLGALLGVGVALLLRRRAKSFATWSHYHYQIRTVGIGFSVYMLGLLPFFVTIFLHGMTEVNVESFGFVPAFFFILVTFFIFFWSVFRVAYGIYRLFICYGINSPNRFI